MTDYCLRSRPARPCPVVYVPGVGGRTGMVSGWSTEEQQVCAFVAVRPMAGTSITERGAVLAGLLADHGLSGVTVVGHSLGAMVAFEAAVRQARRISLLVLIGQYPPHIMSRYGDDDLTQRILPALVAALPDELRADDEFVSTAEERWRLDYQAGAAYQSTANVNVPTVVVGAAEDMKSQDESRLREWKRYCMGSLKTRIVPGDHYFVEHFDASAFHRFLAAGRG